MGDLVGPGAGFCPAGVKRFDFPRLPGRGHANVNQGTNTLHDTPPAMMSDHLIRHTTLRQLQIFEASVRFGSFTRAAEALFLTQPAVSKRVAQLEAELDVRLFDRIGRRISLTGAGTALLPRARRLINDAREPKRLVSDLSGEVRGRLLMATSHHIGLHRGVPLVLHLLPRGASVTTGVLQFGGMYETFARFAELGWTAVPFAEDDGGFDGGPVDIMVVMQSLGRGLVVAGELEDEGVVAFGRVGVGELGFELIGEVEVVRSR